ncbi:hypothetical protein ACPCBC_24450 [Streptomyces incarnatus]|nr:MULTISPECIES: hypothetical protein [Streptomyces]
MGDQSEVAVAPVEAFAPPCRVAVFTEIPTEDRSGYGETNARMEELVKDVPGYLGVHGPGKEPWEVYVVKADADTLGRSADSQGAPDGCCATRATEPASPSACCG